MTNRIPPNRSRMESGARLAPWWQPAILLALSALLWIGVGCAAEETTGNPPGATAAQTSSSASARPTTATTSPRAGGVAPAAAESPLALTQPADQQGRDSAPKGDGPAGAMTAADFPVPPERDLRMLARQMRWQGVEPTAAMPIAGDWQVGDVRDFWTLDYPRRAMVSNPFRLAAITENAYWWAGADETVADNRLARTIDGAESQVFPRVKAVFADGDEPERVHVVNGRIPGIGGYVSASDWHPASVSPYSNEAPAIYVNTRAAAYGDDGFLDILAHELQHAIHQEADESEATWLNEGLSELAVTEAGYQAGSIYHYLRRPSASLVNWPDELGQDVGLNYGASALFAHYLREEYAADGRLQDLLAIEADGIAAVDEFLSRRGAKTPDGAPSNFHAVFADWMVANLLDEDSGVHGYDDLDVQASITRRQSADDDDKESAANTLAQYGIDYVHVRDAEDGATVYFEGQDATPLLPTEVAGECWWSNRGDSISATLTRRLTVPATAPDGSEPTLTYRYWHDIEEEWDYLYVSASTDGGETWKALAATGTTDANPVGNGYGHGYTGVSDGWQDGAASLSDYAGQDALLRFHYVTDDAINGPGMCVQNMRISGQPRPDGAEHWAADGFVLVNNRVRQDWIVWVITDGPEPSATRMELAWDSERGRRVGSVPVASLSGGRLVAAIAAVAPATMASGEYRVWVYNAR